MCPNNKLTANTEVLLKVCYSETVCPGRRALKVKMSKRQLHLHGAD